MSDTLEAKAHELIGQLNPGTLAALVHLLEVMVHEGEEPVTEEDRPRYSEGQSFFANGEGIPMEDVLVDFGLKLDDFRTFWDIDWKDARPGEHTITARATDARGRVQPSPNDDFIALKQTYWEANQQAVRKI